jgi:hypothetical protein
MAAQTTTLLEETILPDGPHHQQHQQGCYSSPLGSPLSSSSSLSSPQESVMMADTTTPQDFGDLMFMAVDATDTVPTRASASSAVVDSAAAARRMMMLPTVPTTKLPSMATVFTRSPSQTRCDVEALLASFQPIDAQLILSLPNNSSHHQHQQQQQQQQYHQQQQVMSGRRNGGGGSVISGDLDSHVVSSTTPDFYLPSSSTSSTTTASVLLSDEHPGKLVLNDNIMWCGSVLPPTSETAQTVPVQYMDPSDGGFVNLGDIDFDYLYPATVEPTPPPSSSLLAAGGGGGSNQERQLSFSML